MATYHMDVAALINNIKTRLGEYPYGEHGHSIFKEPLQNADDTRATRFELLLLDRGFEPDVIHNPLLQGPAFVAINDGPFTKKDARNITSITGTSKSQDTGAVGRFGLGQQAANPMRRTNSVC